ncbi:MAG: radical SAM protein [Candidatus Omnitrophica bacterium]|nr:radical SAM protein [Candidatus Omnitrophota bacterium]
MIPCTKIFKGERTEHNHRKMGPLFVWNVISQCNLRCGHCYRDSASGVVEQGLSDDKCLSLVREIAFVNPPILLLTGGEPLLRKNIFSIIAACKAVGLRVGLSTNGTLIDRAMAEKIAQAGVNYVGVSIDGDEDSHDKFRGFSGAYGASWEGLKHLNSLGVKTGVRFTLTAANSHELLNVLHKTVQSGIQRFCLYHLVYAGRASAGLDLSVAAKRECMARFLKRVKELSKSHPDLEVLTTDNPADGIFMARYSNNEDAILSCISSHGGCSAGDRVVYLDSTGDVYPCQFLRNHSLGNVKESSLDHIWKNLENEFLSQLRNKKSFLEGKCGTCSHGEICGGCRARALAYHGSFWAEDPACYLEQSEIEKNVLSVHA